MGHVHRLGLWAMGEAWICGWGLRVGGTEVEGEWRPSDLGAQWLGVIDVFLYTPNGLCKPGDGSLVLLCQHLLL